MAAFLLYLVGLLLIAAVAWAAARPLFAGSAEPRAADAAPRDDHWIKQKEEAIAAIKETEIDFHVGKLSESDYRDLRARLEARAVEAMRALERETK